MGKVLAGAIFFYCATGLAATYSEVRKELDELLRRFEFDASVLPQVEAKLTEAERKLWDDPPANLGDEGRHLSEVKRNLGVYKEQLPAYESVKKTLEEMLAKVKAGKNIRGLHLRLSSIRRTKIDKVLTSPYMQRRRRQLGDLVSEISKASKDMEKAGKRARVSAAQKRLEVEKRKKEKERQRRLRELKRARTPKYFLDSEFDTGTDGWEPYKGWISHSTMAPDTQEMGFLKYEHGEHSRSASGCMIVSHKRTNLKFALGMMIEARIYREKAATMSFGLQAGPYLERLHFTVPEKEWVTVSKTVTGRSVRVMADGQKEFKVLDQGTAYTAIGMRDLAGYVPAQRGVVYIDYIRILPPPEPEEEEQPDGAQP